jgi:hypothetical protein
MNHITKTYTLRDTVNQPTAKTGASSFVSVDWKLAWRVWIR